VVCSSRLEIRTLLVGQTIGHDVVLFLEGAEHEFGGDEISSKEKRELMMNLLHRLTAVHPSIHPQHYHSGVEPGRGTHTSLQPAPLDTDHTHTDVPVCPACPLSSAFRAERRTPRPCPVRVSLPPVAP
jgi:hypothetical protein